MWFIGIVVEFEEFSQGYSKTNLLKLHDVERQDAESRVTRLVKVSVFVVSFLYLKQDAQ